MSVLLHHVDAGLFVRIISREARIAESMLRVADQVAERAHLEISEGIGAQDPADLRDRMLACDQHVTARYISTIITR